MTIDIKELTKRDLCDIVSLQDTVCESLDIEEWYFPTSEKQFKQWLKDKSNVLYGAWARYELVAISCECKNGYFYTPTVMERLDMTSDELACHEIVIVHPEFRGLSLMDRLMRATTAKCKENGFKAMWCCVHPDNIYSKRNIVNNGYSLLDEVVTPNGWKRDLMYKLL